MAVQTRFREFRGRMGWTQTQLSTYARVTPNSIRTLERGQVEKVQPATLARVAHAMGVSVVDLIPSFGYRPAKPQINLRLHP